MVSEIKAICKEKHKSIYFLERTLGFGNGSIAKWDKSAPSYDKVQKVADLLEVPISRIIGDADNKKSPAQKGEAVTQESVDSYIDSIDDPKLLSYMLQQIAKRQMELYSKN